MDDLERLGHPKHLVPAAGAFNTNPRYPLEAPNGQWPYITGPYIPTA